MMPAVLAGSANNAAAQEASGFSFVVYGDSRPMMYLPFRLDQSEEATKLMVDMFALVLTEKVAE